jgi:integrase/recombinase XerD
MKLWDLTAKYVGYKQSMGMRFRTEARVLKSFCRNIGDADVDQLTPDAVEAFLAGTGPVTRFWHRKYEVLSGFYRFAIARGHADRSPLPRAVPKPPPPFVPYIYSQDELQRLLSAAESFQHVRAKMETQTCRTLLLLLYGAGLRISEALSLTLLDVDVASAVLTIRESKFYKSRWVPIGPKLAHTLASYQSFRLPQHPSQTASPFLVSRSGQQLTVSIAERTFRKLCVDAGIVRGDGARYQPRLHDLRHTAAVHRLVSWYCAGADVQKLLPQLATYLGHVHIAATQRYLTMTPELLREASRLFERYAGEAPGE